MVNKLWIKMGPLRHSNAKEQIQWGKILPFTSSNHALNSFRHNWRRHNITAGGLAWLKKEWEVNRIHYDKCWQHTAAILIMPIQWNVNIEISQICPLKFSSFKERTQNECNNSRQGSPCFQLIKEHLRILSLPHVHTYSQLLKISWDLNS